MSKRPRDIGGLPTFKKSWTLSWSMYSAGGTLEEWIHRYARIRPSKPPEPVTVYNGDGTPIARITTCPTTGKRTRVSL